MVRVTEEIFNGKLHFFCSVKVLTLVTSSRWFVRVGSKNPNAIPEVTVTAPIEKYTASDIIETLQTCWEENGHCKYCSKGKTKASPNFVEFYFCDTYVISKFFSFDEVGKSGLLAM